MLSRFASLMKLARTLRACMYTCVPPAIAKTRSYLVRASFGGIEQMQVPKICSVKAAVSCQKSFCIAQRMSSHQKVCDHSVAFPTSLSIASPTPASI